MFEILGFLWQTLGQRASEPGQTPQICKIQIFTISIWGFHFEKMTQHNHLEDNLGGDDNFQAWKYRISLIVEENDLDKFISGDVLELEGDEEKDAHKRSMDKAKRIIADSIKDHLIPHVSAFKAPK